MIHLLYSPCAFIQLRTEDTQDLLVAKRVYKMVQDGAHVTPADNYKSLINKSIRMLNGTFFLDMFFDRARKQGVEVCSEYNDETEGVFLVF